MTGWSAANDEFSLLIEPNPLTEFVEVPPELAQELRSVLFLSFSGSFTGFIVTTWVSNVSTFANFAYKLRVV